MRVRRCSSTARPWATGCGPGPAGARSPSTPVGGPTPKLRSGLSEPAEGASAHLPRCVRRAAWHGGRVAVMQQATGSSLPLCDGVGRWPSFGSILVLISDFKPITVSDGLASLRTKRVQPIAHPAVLPGLHADHSVHGRQLIGAGILIGRSSSRAEVGRKDRWSRHSLQPSAIFLARGSASARKNPAQPSAVISTQNLAAPHSARSICRSRGRWRWPAGGTLTSASITVLVKKAPSPDGFRHTD
jgi:hypothetical protein